MLDRFSKEIVQDEALSGALGYYRALPFLGHTPVVRVPTTMIWSDGDNLLGRTCAQLSARYVDAPYDFVVLTGVSHWIPDHAPEALVELVIARADSVRGDA